MSYIYFGIEKNRKLSEKDVSCKAEKLGIEKISIKSFDRVKNLKYLKIRIRNSSQSLMLARKVT